MKRAIAILFSVGAFALLIMYLFKEEENPRLEQAQRRTTPSSSGEASQVPHPALIIDGELSPFQRALLRDVERQLAATIHYEDGYYQSGDPPPEIGVCTDVVLRAFSAAGVDLYQRMNEDIRRNLQAYPIRRPDPSIDARRCRNMIQFFRRHAKELPVQDNRLTDWQPGDIVFWDAKLQGDANHVGIVVTQEEAEGKPLIAHHWPGREVDISGGLFRFPVKGHFRWEE
ncbi:MAG: DUF1287 domain-containing protein [Fimbriimonadia bacterium]|nr:DUF1287 domain-containing protein [Fimbriimonadia bacterium]